MKVMYSNIIRRTERLMSHLNYQRIFNKLKSQYLNLVYLVKASRNCHLGTGLASIYGNSQITTIRIKNSIMSQFKITPMMNMSTILQMFKQKITKFALSTSIRIKNLSTKSRFKRTTEIRTTLMIILIKFKKYVLMQKNKNQYDVTKMNKNASLYNSYQNWKNQIKKKKKNAIPKNLRTKTINWTVMARLKLKFFRHLI